MKGDAHIDVQRIEAVPPFMRWMAVWTYKPTHNDLGALESRGYFAWTRARAIAKCEKSLRRHIAREATKARIEIQPHDAGSSAT